jgi:competence CoiA-like predicted nuclease
MLAALHEDVRVYASAAKKGLNYLCPACKAPLILRKGAIRVHHFAHRPPAGCLWSRGETIAHLEAKLAMHRAFLPRAFKAEMEWPLEALDGDRRADVFVWDMRGGKVAFELQHTAIGAEEIARRSAAYMRAGVAVMWIPFLRPRYRAAAERAAGGPAGDWVIRRYTPRAFER